MGEVDFTSKDTGAGLIEFLEFAIEKGHMKRATGQAFKTAVKEILSAVEGDAWESVELSNIEEEDLLARFETLRAMKYSPGSLATYKQRYSRAAAMFREFRASPAGWRPNSERPPRAGKSGGRSVRSTSRPARLGGPLPSDRSSSDVQSGLGASKITYPFPLRPDALVSVELPADLTRREARRLAVFIESLAIEDVNTGASGYPAGSDSDRDG